MAHAERRRATHAELAITARRAGGEGSTPAPALLLGATAGFLLEAAAAARASGLAGAGPRVAARLVNLAGALPRRWRAAGASVALSTYVTDEERVAERGAVAAVRLRLPDKESVQEDNKIIECRVRVDYHYHLGLACALLATVALLVRGLLPAASGAESSRRAARSWPASWPASARPTSSSCLRPQTQQYR